ncbi:type IV secretory system conjugative DNA transfer family protein [Peribacillus butanolivorans]|uniref:type IV secretory system conjugative DNA transfer family protein n=1 Tax=Peribacillus butanolivorans TaxID=421767 RepID=UPI0013793592|nr:type IV secretory system conjugative DNA transfer family protein [Peribacillus butanolivorans]
MKNEQKNLGTDFLITKNEREFKEEQHLLLSQHIKLRQEKFFQHCLIISATGTGKSASILLPQIKNLDGNISAVVTDPKAELYKKTYRELVEKGLKPVLLKLDRPEVSIKYNLLSNCRNPNDVQKLAEAILGAQDDEWGRMGVPLLSAFLFRQYFQGGTITDVVKDLAECPQDIYEMELEYFKEEDVNKYSKMAFGQFKKVSGAGNAVGSLFLTIQGKMKVFEYENIEEISKGDSFKIDSMRREKIVLFISYPEEDSKTYEPFLSSFYFQVFNILKGDESVDESAGAAVGLPVYFLLDEFANIGRIPSMDNLISTIRSKKMGVEIFLQNIEQLQAVYGNDIAKTIISNCSTKLTMYGNSEESSKFFSNMAGKKEVESLSVSFGDKGSTNYTSSIQEKPVISPDEIRRLVENEILIITSNIRPIKDYKNYYFRDNLDLWVHNKRISKENKKRLRKLLKLILRK